MKIRGKTTKIQHKNTEEELNIEQCEEEALKIKAKTKCDNIRNEVNQLLCMTAGVMEGIHHESEVIEEVRSRIKAIKDGVKHPLRYDKPKKL